METRPSSLNMGAITALLGGLAVVVAFAVLYNPEGERPVVTATYYVLTAIVYFAVAGGFRKEGQWPVELMIIMSFLAIGLVIIGTLVGFLGIYFMIALLILGIITLMSILGCLSSTVWFGSLD